MKYSQYLSQIIQSHGAPQMDGNQFRQLMNVVSLEGQLKGLHKAKKVAATTGEPRKFDVQIFQVNSMITDISGNLAPADFIKLLLESS
ncbi:MAG: hypothetical protein ACI837_001789 [Crocinitomicaceae bacterium]|jgi:hypothetical protein